jgi:streptogramin lyase
MAKSEFKVLYRIFAIAGTLLVVAVIAGYIYLRVNSPHFFQFSGELSTTTVDIHIDSLSTAYFLQGMQGCENLWLDDTSFRMYVTDLSGHIYLVDGAGRQSLAILKKKRVGEMAMAAAASKKGELFFTASEVPFDEWIEVGGYLYRSRPDLDSIEKFAGPWPSANGIGIGKSGKVYVTSGNANPFNPEGKIIAVDPANPGREEVVIEEAGTANGFWFEPSGDRFLYSNTVEGVFEVNIETGLVTPVYFKTAFFEFTDDICRDSKGNLWMTDPATSTVKLLIPTDSLLIRFDIKGFGQASSCRTRLEPEGEVLYISEINQKQNIRATDYDGRGVLSVRLEELYGLLDDGI